MLLLNILNIENLVFQDAKVRTLLPSLHHIFDQWLMAQRIPYLRSLRLRAVMDLLSNLNEEHINILEEHFQDSIVLAKVDYHIVKNLVATTVEIEKELNQLDSSFQNLALSRDENSVYVSMWR